MSLQSRRADTIAHIRSRELLLGTKAKARAIPKQRPPIHVELHYYQLLKPLLNEMRRLTLSDVVSQLAQWEAEAKTYRLDSAGSDAKKAISAASAAILREFDNSNLENLTERIGRQLSDYQKQQLQNQIVAAFSVDIVRSEPWLGPMIQDFVAQNVSLIKSIPQRYFSEIESLVIRELSKGSRPEAIETALTERYDVSEYNAKRIAKDQSNKFFGLLNAARQKDLGIERFIWRSAEDERVRPEHETLDGQSFAYSDPPSEGLPGEPVLCFPGDTRVRLFKASIDKLYRRLYRGDLTTLVTDEGSALSSTPNHPLLTSRGWIAAKDIDVGDYVIKAASERGKLLIQNPECGDPLFSQVFRAANLFGTIDFTRLSAGGFHGDAPIDQEIDIVDVNRGLWIEGYSQLSQSFCKQLLARANKGGSLECPLSSGFNGAPRASDGDMGCICEQGALFGGHLSMTLQHGSSAIAWLESVTKELIANGFSADAKLFRECLNTHSRSSKTQGLLSRILFGIWRRAIDTPFGFHTPSSEELGQPVSTNAENVGCFGDGTVIEKFCRVREKSVSKFMSHVYNLQTSSSWYVAQGLIAHNCRCIAEPDFTGIVKAFEE